VQTRGAQCAANRYGVLRAVVGYGEKEVGRNLSNFDSELPLSSDWQDMDKRIEFLDREGLATQVIYPTEDVYGSELITERRWRLCY